MLCLHRTMSALIIVTVLVACSKNNGNAPNSLAKKGIQPYNLSKNEKDLSRSFGIEEENSQIIYFNAPKEAIAMDINVYKLGGGEKWEIIGGRASFKIGTIMRSYSLQDYFEPSKFEGMDLVQVVTLTFRSE